MMAFRTRCVPSTEEAFLPGSPALSDRRLRDMERDGTVMTVAGTVRKTLLLMVILAVSAIGAYAGIANSILSANPLILTGSIGGFVLAMATIRNPRIAPWLSPLYTVLEGLAIGAVTYLVEAAAPGAATTDRRAVGVRGPGGNKYSVAHRQELQYAAGIRQRP